MNITIVDYNSGNISSVINSFKEVGKNKYDIQKMIKKIGIKTRRIANKNIFSNEKIVVIPHFLSNDIAEKI